MAIIQVGADAPDFELSSSELDNDKPGKKIKLSDYRGKQAVVLAFYPLDFSPTCTGEMKCFRDDLSALEGANAAVLGVSVDSAWTHAAFKRELGLKFPLVADFHPKGAMADTYGLYHADKGITGRATVIVNKAGKVAWVKEQGLGEARDNKAILAALAALK